jgi:hypothetical protein
MFYTFGNKALVAESSSLSSGFPHTFLSYLSMHQKHNSLQEISHGFRAI